MTALCSIAPVTSKATSLLETSFACRVTSASERDKTTIPTLSPPTSTGTAANCWQLTAQRSVVRGRSVFMTCSTQLSMGSCDSDWPVPQLPRTWPRLLIIKISSMPASSCSAGHCASSACSTSSVLFACRGGPRLTEAAVKPASCLKLSDERASAKRISRCWRSWCWWRRPVPAPTCCWR